MRVKCPECGRERIIQDWKRAKKCRKCGLPLSIKKHAMTPDGVVDAPEGLEIPPIVAEVEEIIEELVSEDTPNEAELPKKKRKYTKKVKK